jgi:hypothetical protein
MMSFSELACSLLGDFPLVHFQSSQGLLHDGLRDVQTDSASGGRVDHDVLSW